MSIDCESPKEWPKHVVRPSEPGFYEVRPLTGFLGSKEHSEWYFVYYDGFSDLSQCLVPDITQTKVVMVPFGTLIAEWRVTGVVTYEDAVARVLRGSKVWSL